MIKKRSSGKISTYRSKKGKILGVVFGIILLGASLGTYMVLGPNTGKLPEHHLFIRGGDSYEMVLDKLKSGGFIFSRLSFDLLAKSAGYPGMVKPGRYRITPLMSNYAMVKMLRNGNQDPVRLVINKLRTKEDFVQFLAGNLEADTVELRQLLQSDTFLSRFGLDSNKALCGIIPDTYEFWWNTSARKALSRLFDYRQKFWIPERIAKAEALKLSPDSVYILASIVEEESNKNDEKPDIASVYINRLNAGMPLQADPTVKFALGDFTIKRVMSNHLKVESPYNTYLNRGLPPGPICTPSQITIDAVLNARRTNYLYFCAKSDFSGYHTFSSNYNTHLENARAYAKALNERGVR